MFAGNMIALAGPGTTLDRSLGTEETGRIDSRFGGVHD
jgi:hypothetical protein